MLNRFRLLAAILLAALAIVACEGPDLGGSDESVAAVAAADYAMPEPAFALTESESAAMGESFESLELDTLDRQIIREGRINIEVKDVLIEFDRIGDIAIQSGGFVAESSVYSSPRDEQGEIPPAQGAYLRLRVPADRFDTVRERIAQLADSVLSQNTSSQDVTMQVADFEARLRNLRSTEQQYLNLLNDAEDVEEVIQVTDRLSGTRGEIERIEAQLEALSSLVELSTLHVDIQRVFDPEEEDVRGPLDAAREGWEASWRVLEAILEWSLAVIAFSWWLVPLAILGGAVALVLNRRRTAAGPGGRAGSEP
jgi:hypothetical protein